LLKSGFLIKHNFCTSGEIDKRNRRFQSVPIIIIIIIIAIIPHESHLHNLISGSSNYFFKGHPIRLRPFGLNFGVIFAILMLFNLVKCRSQFDLLRERDHWGDPEVDGRIILRWLFRKS
jgi:hypothetical protein